MQNIKSTKIVVILMAILISTSACTNSRGEIHYKKTGALIGAAIGAGAGQLIGLNSETTLLGGAIGLIAGTGIAAYMDEQEGELEEATDETDVCVQKVKNNIILVMPDNITFDTDSAVIKPAFSQTLKQVAAVINRYEKTVIEVSGFTDNVGDDMYNKALSQRRAESVVNFLSKNGIAKERLYAKGYGEKMPLVSNETPEGRAMNRRVELKIKPVMEKF